VNKLAVLILAFAVGCGLAPEPAETSEPGALPECEGRLEIVVTTGTIVTSPRPHRSEHLPPEVQSWTALEYVCVVPGPWTPGNPDGGSRNPPQDPDDGLVRVGVNGRCHRVAPGHLVPRGAHWPGPWTIETECP
jgi:hypothetical protein